jgi:hypothetical protein
MSYPPFTHCFASQLVDSLFSLSRKDLFETIQSHVEVDVGPSKHPKPSSEAGYATLEYQTPKEKLHCAGVLESKLGQNTTCGRQWPCNDRPVTP